MQKKSTYICGQLDVRPYTQFLSFNLIFESNFVTPHNFIHMIRIFSSKVYKIEPKDNLHLPIF